MAGFARLFERAIVFTARLFAVVVGVVVGALVWAEMSDNAIVVEEISVPDELARTGYTPSVTAHLILDEWRKIDRTATTTKRRREIGFNRGQVELSLPSVNISIGSFVDYFKAKIGIDQERLRGGIVVADSVEPQCFYGCYAFFLDLDGRNPQHFVVPARPKSEVEGLIRDAARLAVEKLDPYLLANFYFASRGAEPRGETEIPRLVQYVLDTPPSDDDPWALTLRGAMLNRQEKWSEAIPNFDGALQLDGKFASAFNSRCWAKGHLPGQAGTAVSDCRTALRLNPKSYQTMDSLAFALEQNGQINDAFATIKCARRISGKDGDIQKTYDRLLARLPQADTATPTEKECQTF